MDDHGEDGRRVVVVWKEMDYLIGWGGIVGEGVSGSGVIGWFGLDVCWGLFVDCEEIDDNVAVVSMLCAPVRLCVGCYNAAICYCTCTAYATIFLAL